MQKSLSNGNIIKSLILAAITAACIFFFRRLIAGALGIVFGACLLCFLLSPPAKLLEKKLSRTLSAVLSVAIAAAVLLAALGLLAPLLARQFSQLLPMIPAALDRLAALMEGLVLRLREVFPDMQLPEAPDARSLLSGIDLRSIEGGLSGVARGAIATVSGAAGALYRLALCVILACFFLIDREKMLLRLELLIPMRWRRDGVRLGKSLLRELRLYLRGQATIALGVGALSALGLSLIGLDGGFLLGLIVGLCNIIPYFGPLIGSIPAVLLALSEGWRMAAFTAGLLFLVQQIDSMVLSPRIMGSITGFSPALVLLALYLASRTGGIIGLLLAMPLLMTVRTLYRVLVQSRLPESGHPVHCAE